MTECHLEEWSNPRVSRKLNGLSSLVVYRYVWKTLPTLHSLTYQVTNSLSLAASVRLVQPRPIFAPPVGQRDRFPLLFMAVWHAGHGGRSIAGASDTPPVYIAGASVPSSNAASQEHRRVSRFLNQHGCVGEGKHCSGKCVVGWPMRFFLGCKVADRAGVSAPVF